MSIVQRAPGGSVLPTHLDLPHTDNEPVENTYQPLQAMVLTSSLASVLDRLHPDGNYYIGADTGIYWRQTQPPERGCRAPDWYYVPNVPRLLDGILRLSYVLWQEKVSPTIVVEVVSGTGAEERDDTPNTGKFWIYEQVIKAQYYVIWEHLEDRLDVYELGDEGYRKLSPGANGRVRIPPMQIELGVHESEFFGNPSPWLRGWDLQGKLISTTEERVEAVEQLVATEKQRVEIQKQRAESEKQRAESEKQRADSEKQRAESEKRRADKLAAKLRELGLDPDAG